MEPEETLLASIAAPTRAQVRGYVEEMTLELAQMASACGETALAASLALVAIQAGSKSEPPASGA